MSDCVLIPENSSEPNSEVHPKTAVSCPDPNVSPLAEITKGVTLLFQPGDVVEFRALGTHPTKFYNLTRSGFFDDLNLLAQAIEEVNSFEGGISCFYVINPLRRDWQGVNNCVYASASALRQDILASGIALEDSPRLNKETDEETGKTKYRMRTSEDRDVFVRRHILLDCDAGQSAGTNSSDAEKANAEKMARDISLFLQHKGFPQPALCDSGNGWHCIITCNLSNDVDSLDLCERFLKAIAAEFNGKYGKAELDTSVANAARLTKAYGSVVYKGTGDDPERPFRRSRVVDTGEMKEATVDQLRSIADVFAAAPRFESEEVIPKTEQEKRFLLLKEYLRQHEINIVGPRFTRRGSLCLPIDCPNKENHSKDTGDRQTMVSIQTSGDPGFKCFHKGNNLCPSLHFKEFCKMVDPVNPPLNFTPTIVFGKKSKTKSKILSQDIDSEGI